MNNHMPYLESEESAEQEKKQKGQGQKNTCTRSNA